MEQNDERLESLYSKISSIKNVTIDIHSDSLSQNRLLNQTVRSFSHLIPQNPQSNHLFVVMKPQAEELMFQNCIIYLKRNGVYKKKGEQFDSFTSQLSDSASRFSRTIQAGSSQRKTIIYTVGGVVGLFFLYRIFG
ncbi:hypothetical protein KEM48_011277 [Puccinia striiformis f. sp. tritici PST-130]|nr:hypothetical protein KEM48_011277 [Puccinia striiformis f. sp. tritici PST-130]